MDLYRVVTASGNIDKELPKQSVIEFMKHADKDFEKNEKNKTMPTIIIITRINNTKIDSMNCTWPFFIAKITEGNPFFPDLYFY